MSEVRKEVPKQKVLISLFKNVLSTSKCKNFNFDHFWSLFCQLMDLNHVQTSWYWYQLVLNGSFDLISEKNKKSNAGCMTQFFVVHQK